MCPRTLYICVLIHSTCVLIHSICVLIHSVCVRIHSMCPHTLCVLIHYMCLHTLCMCAHTLYMCPHTLYMFPHALYMFADRRIVDVRRGGHAASSMHLYVSAYTTYVCVRIHYIYIMCPHTLYTCICVRIHYIYTYIYMSADSRYASPLALCMCAHVRRHTQILDVEADAALTLTVVSSINLLSVVSRGGRGVDAYSSL